ncbi:MAG: DNA polymerase III subunit alpha [Bacteroidota bacterium]|nr:DNA polymerase III subunit alpha [Bacteroidota bacterium]MDP4232218.1 DNA polymerase III subunit alpha [Bacteroidota bacterium]MDP4243601.1 DNA polymerase III subunit alpha [Bacteroidota bacterium]MDP4288747.1 DNA polymerase III subunit alpha [Bacteroidota bacterium]
MAEFVHLHNHTHYSILDGACSVSDLVDAAKAEEMKAVALTDHGVLFGAFEFYKKAKAAGIKPIVGCEVYFVSDGSATERERFDDPEGKKKAYNHLILLAKNEIGYQNLMKLVSRGHTEGFYYKPRIDWSMLEENHEGLIATTACSGGIIGPSLVSGDYEKAKRIATRFRDVFDKDFYLEIQDHGLEREIAVREHSPRLAKELGIKLVGTNDCHYVRQSHAVAHNVLLMIRDSSSKDTPNVHNLKYGTDTNYFRSAKEMTKLFSQWPEAIDSTLEIMEKCDLTLSKDFKMPAFPIPPESGTQTLEAYLEHLTNEGLSKRFSQSSREIEDRAEFELGVINRMGYAGYFLIVQDFIAAARKMGVTVGPGRGSAAGSLVAYALGITNVDPIKYNLLFERFLNPERVSMPDIDIDFSDDKRELVIDYVREKYGRESVAQIITFSTLSARAVLKDVGRVLGVPLSTINELTKCIPVIMGRVTPLKEAIELPEMKMVLSAHKDPLIDQLIEYSLVLEGFARAASKHAAGVVIAPGDISNYVPLYKTPSLEEAVTQFNMKDVEEAGLLKMDFLGLRTLSIIDTTLALIEQNHGVKIDIDTIPLDDAKTYEMFGRGETVAVFQFDSPPMQNHMRALKPENMEDLSSMNALYRPGPMDHIPEFIDRKQGRRKVEYLHPKLEPILAETYGVIVVQEQVMRVARDLAGFSLAKADEMRRAMGKKDLAKMEAMKEAFIKGCVANDVADKIAKELYEQLAKFASYGFNKSHSLAYALIAYQTAYLKAHYTAEFLAANMTHEMNDADYVVQLIDEAKKFNIRTLAPDVNLSNVHFSASREGIRFGLAGIKNVGEKAVEEIVRERTKNGPFTSLFNFTSRLDTRLVNRRAIEALVEAGAFDSCDTTGLATAAFRSDLFANVELALQYGQRVRDEAKSSQNSLFGDADTPHVLAPPTMVYAEKRWTEIEMLSHEKKSVGYYVSGHPLEPHRIDVLSFVTHKAIDLNDAKQGDPVIVGGVIVAITRKLDRNGNAFAILKLEDFTGKTECVLWSDAYKQCQNLIQDEKPVFLRGKVRRNGPEEAPSVIVDEAFEIRGLRKKLTRGILVRLFDSEQIQPTISQVERICGRYRGNCTTFVSVETAQGISRKYRLPEQFQVDPNDDLIREFGEVFGTNRILFTR